MFSPNCRNNRLQSHDGRKFFDQLVKNNPRAFENIWKIVTGQGDDYTTHGLWNYPFSKTC